MLLRLPARRAARRALAGVPRRRARRRASPSPRELPVLDETALAERRCAQRRAARRRGRPSVPSPSRTSSQSSAGSRSTSARSRKLVVDAPVVLAPGERRHDPLAAPAATPPRAASRSSRRRPPPRRSSAAAPPRSSQVSTKATSDDSRRRRRTRVAATSANAPTYAEVHAPAAGARSGRGWRPPAAGRRAEGADARFAASRLAKIAPKSETPIEPPICRKSVEPEVATPSSSYGHRVLGGEDEHLHRHPEPEAEHDHVRAPSARRASSTPIPREEVHRQRHQRRPDDRERLVAAEAADQLPAADRGHEQAGHHRRQQRAPTRVGLWPLTIWR